MDGSLSTRSIERKDGWTPELDQLLLDIVIEGLSKGLTQVACFAKAAEKIGKSNSACAFRFNTTIRKQASEAIERAKLAGKGKKTAEQEDSGATDVQFQSDDEVAVLETADVQTDLQTESQSKTLGIEVVETFQKIPDVHELYRNLGQPSLETVIQMLQMIQQHNGLAEENTYHKKIDQLETLIGNALSQVDQLKFQLQTALEELQMMRD